MRSLTAKFSTGVLAIVLCSGCSVWNKDKTRSKSNNWSLTSLWKKEYQKPESLAVIWSPDILTMPGKAPTRGFGGRVYFYNNKTQAIPVEGELVVHGYRGTERPGQSEQISADKTFGFTAEQLTGHFSPSELGASYSIWIPWDAADGFREEVTLIPTFKGKAGSLVQGTPAKVYLPGRSRTPERDAKVSAQTVSYRSSSIPTNPGIELPRAKSGLRTTTIEVPASASLVRQPKKRKTYAPPESYLLGGRTSASAAQGVSTGGQMRAPSNSAYPNTMPPNSGPQGGWPQHPASRASATSGGVTRPNALRRDLPALPADVPAEASGKQRELRGLLPGTQRNFGPLGSPIAHQPWYQRTGRVQPASFND